MKRFWYFAVLLAVMLAVSGCQSNAQPEVPAAHVLVGAITGEAQFQHTNDGEKQSLTVGQALVESDIITSGAGALIVITLEEGKEIHIGENTIFALSAIRRDADGNVNILALKQGSIVNIVDTPLGESDVYEVHTPRLVMSVRGTSNYMESTERGDTVIGITGETHVFSDAGAANVVAGMKAEMNQNTTSPKLSPLASRALPKLASNFAKQREISYGAIAQEDIEQAQQGADSHKPSDRYANDFSGRLFEDDALTVPDSGNSGDAPVSSMSAPSESSSEAASSDSSEQEPESSGETAPAVMETAVSSTAPVQPTPVAQTPQSSIASSSSKAESSSSTSSSGSRNNNSYTSSSSGSGSRNNDSYTSSKSSSPKSSSSSTPAPSSSTPAPSSSSNPAPPPTTANITVYYEDALSGNSVGTQSVQLTGNGTFMLTKNNLSIPVNCYLSSTIDGSSHLGANENQFPISVSDGEVVHVYVFNSTASAIVLRFYTPGTGYQGKDGLQIPLSSLFTPNGINLGTATAAAQAQLNHPTYGISADAVIDGQITLDMLYLPGKTTTDPAGFDPANTSNSFEIWIPITIPTVGN